MHSRLRGFPFALVLTVALAAEPARGAEPTTAAAPSGGIRTDLLARGELDTWRKIVTIVLAEGPCGQPLHPTLRALWDSVASSGHTVYIQMRDRKAARSHLAGGFTITRVDPSGESHEAVLTLNLRTIDAASTGAPGRRASGFTPFDGLGRTQRYAEVLGHELAHAVSSLAGIAQAQLAVRRDGEVQEYLRLLREGWARRSPAEALERAQELGRLIQLSEEPAEAVEMIIWKELREGARSAPCGNKPRHQAQDSQSPRRLR